jgi:hypothetical protein
MNVDNLLKDVDETSESNFERDKNKLLDAIAFSFGEDEDD